MPQLKVIIPDDIDPESISPELRKYLANDRHLTIPHDRVHVTDVTVGLRETYLKYTTDFVETLDDRMAVAPQSLYHAALEINSPDTSTFSHGNLIGSVDDWEADAKEMRIYDFKFVGAYKVKLMLGLDKHTEPILDEEGNKIMWRGKPRVNTSFLPTLIPDLSPYDDQMNIYRGLMREEGFCADRKIRCFLNVVPRDAGTVAGRMHGVTKRFYSIEIPDNKTAIEQAHIRADELLEAFATKTPPPPCLSVHSWEGRKCRQYCAVANACANLCDNQWFDEE